MSSKTITDLSSFNKLEDFGSENLREILDNMGDPVFVKDRQSRLMLVNDAFCQMFNMPREEIIGKTLAEDVTPEEREHFITMDRQVLSDGLESIVEESLTVRGGAKRTISTRKTRYIDELGNAYLIGVIRDITERIEAEELSRLNKLNELLLRAAQMLSEPDKNMVQALGELTKLVAAQFRAVCDVSILNKEEGVIEPIAVHHHDDEVRTVVKELFSSMVVRKGQGLVGAVIEKGEELLIENVPESMKHGPARVNPKIVPVSIMYVPLKGSIGVLGSMNLTRLQGEEPFSKNDILQIRKIGQYISLFVESILLRQEREELAELRRQSEERLSNEKRWTDFKIEVLELLADVETELEEILQNLCVRITEFFDVVSDFQLVQEDGETIRLVAVHHHNSQVLGAIKKILVRPELKVGSGMVGKVVESATELYIDDLPEELKRKVDAEVDPLIIPCSFAYLPLTSRGKVLGTLDLTRLKGQPGISKDELTRMRDLAGHAARFIDNRLLQQQQKEIERRKKAEQKLEQSTKKLVQLEAETRQMLNTIPVYIARVTKNLRYRFLNDTYKLRGVEPKSLEGKHVWELLGEYGLQVFSSMIDQALAGQVVTFEHVVADKNGNPTYLSVALAPDYDENGEVVGFYSCSTDITSQVLAEKAAQITQERFESLSLNSGDAFFFHDEDQNILDVNQAACEMLGYSRAELLALKAKDIDPRWSQNVYQRFLSELEENVPQTFETSVVAKDGRKIPIESRFVKRVEDGKMYIQSLLRDRTEKREQEEKLERSEHNLRLIFDNVDDIVATMNEDGIVESINRTAQGVSRDEVIGKSAFDWYPEESMKEKVKQGFRTLLETGEGFEIETTSFAGPDGSYRIYYNKYIGKYLDNNTYKVISILRDVTEERNKEQSVMDAALRGQEQERKRLGAELHDGIGQILSAIALQVSRLNETTSLSEQSQFAKGLQELSENLQAAIKEVRNISHDLMPDVLEGFGLKEALSQTCSNLQERSGMLVTFDHVDVNERYDSSLELNLYRITQELLNNAQKHAASKHVFVNLVDHGDILSLTVEDDGVGFDLSHNTDGIGLQNVRSRVNMMHGQFDIETSENSGTLINIEVPKTVK